MVAIKSADLMRRLSGGENWLNNQLQIVLTWGAFCYVAQTDEESVYAWVLDFCESEPWQFAHMANIALFLELSKAENADILNIESDTPTEVLDSYITVLAQRVANCDDDLKKLLWDTHKRILGQEGIDFTRKSMNSNWSTITWAELNKES
jgi:hypothetical protein